jgi:hypothetical protein
MRKWSLLLGLTVIVWVGFASSSPAQNMVIRGYVKAGILVLAPSAEDLDYSTIGGGGDAWTRDWTKTGLGIGAQLLTPISTGNAKKKPMRVGVDVAFQKLFSVKSNLPTYENVYLSEHHDSESSLSILGVGEYALPGTQFFMQGGLGIHMVFWSWTYEHHGSAGSVYKDDGGTGISPALMVGGGTLLPVNEQMSIPIMIRADVLFRYGLMASIGVATGINFSM